MIPMWLGTCYNYQRIECLYYNRFKKLAFYDYYYLYIRH